MEELQSRLRAHEQAEATATLAMQQAARDVAQENAGLRAMLASKGGVSEAEISEFLRSWTPNPVAEVSTYVTRGESVGTPGQGQHRQNPAISEASCTSQQDASMPEGHQTRGVESALETSCDTAATILADFQGHGDTGRARVALGCVSNKSCIVKNTEVFRLIDES